MIVAAVTIPLPPMVRLTGFATFNSPVHPRPTLWIRDAENIRDEHAPGAGPKDAENLMARKVNKLFAMLAAGEPAFINSCWLLLIKMPD